MKRFFIVGRKVENDWTTAGRGKDLQMERGEGWGMPGGRKWGDVERERNCSDPWWAGFNYGDRVCGVVQCNPSFTSLPCSHPNTTLRKGSCCFSVPPGQICASLKVVLFYLDYVQEYDYHLPFGIIWPTQGGEGHGTPLWYSRLENPMDGGAWWAAVHGVSKSRTRLSDFTVTFHFHALEKEMAAHSSVLAWRIPGTGEPGGLPSVGSHRVGHDWSDLAAAAAADQAGKLFWYYKE